jgi:hypothetical protein
MRLCMTLQSIVAASLCCILLIGCFHPKPQTTHKDPAACRIVEKLYLDEEWVPCSQISVWPNGDYLRQEFDVAKAPSRRSQVTGHLPRTILDPLLTASHRFPQTRGVPVYELLLDDTKSEEPSAVKAVRQFVAQDNGDQ